MASEITIKGIRAKRGERMTKGKGVATRGAERTETSFCGNTYRYLQFRRETASHLQCAEVARIASDVVLNVTMVITYDGRDPQEPCESVVRRFL